MGTRIRLMALREQLGSLLRDNKSIIVGELLVIALIPLLWGLLPVPRTIIPLLLLAWLSLWLRHVTWRSIGLSRPRSWSLAATGGIALGALAVLFSVTVISPVFRLVGESTTANTLAAVRGDWPRFLTLLIVTWPLAALLEEMVYRGYVLNRLSDLLGGSPPGWAVSIVLSAAMFSLAHGSYDLRSLATSFLAGLLEGGLYLAGRRNLWMPITFHGVTNSISITLAFLGIQA